jgi:hypothetical protein
MKKKIKVPAMKHKPIRPGMNFWKKVTPVWSPPPKPFKTGLAIVPPESASVFIMGK